MKKITLNEKHTYEKKWLIKLKTVLTKEERRQFKNMINRNIMIIPRGSLIDQNIGILKYLKLIY